MGIVARALGKECVEFTDALGVAHKLPPFDGGDWSDLDSLLGGIPAWKTWGASVRNGLVVVWLSARKEGMTRAEITAAASDMKKWRVAPGDVRGWFANFNDVFELMGAILTASGYLKPDTAEQTFASRVREVLATEKDLAAAKVTIDDAWTKMAAAVAAREASGPLEPTTAPSPNSEPSSADSSTGATPAGSSPTT